MTQENGLSEKRLALVIGNGVYRNASALVNPANDAVDMAETLRRLGFEVLSGTDQKKPQMLKIVRDFGAKLKRNGGVGLFYYAGHGIQVEGHNYLIPVDAAIRSENEVELEAVDVSRVLIEMENAGNALNIVILDACRNNPFARSWRSNSDGLAQISAPTGTLLAYATAPGKVSSDGEGRNGLYTSELLKQLMIPDLMLEEVFKGVRSEVRKKSNGKQVPWESSSVEGNFVFANKKPKPVLEQTAWNEIKDSPETIKFENFLKDYPNGIYAAKAKSKISELQSKIILIPNNTTSVITKSTITNIPNKSLFEPTSKPNLTADVSADVFNKGDIPYRAGIAFENAGKYAEAVKSYKEALLLSPENALYHNSLGNAIFISSAQTEIDTEAADRRKEKRNEMLKGILKSAILSSVGGSGATSPGYTPPRYSYFPLPEEVKTHLKEAVKLAPNVAKYHNDLGIAIFSDKNLRRAKNYLKLKGEVDPPHPLLSSKFATLPTLTVLNINKISEYISPETEFRTAVQLEPNNVVYRRNLGDALIDSFSNSEAEVIFRELLKIEPNSISYRSKLFKALIGQSKWTDAAPIYIELNQAKLDDDEFKYFMKQTYKAKKELQQEVKKLKK